MLKKRLSYVDALYETLKAIWKSKKSSYAISIVLVASFLMCSIFSLLVINNTIDLGGFNDYFSNPFFSVEIVFTMLLITELFGLIFILPNSVAKSVVKQFQLLSLIFLRDGFKEFSHVGANFTWEHLEEYYINMVVYGFGAVVIFLILGVVEKLQRHIRLTDREDDQEQFIRLKKLLALLTLIAFAVVGYIDIKTLLATGNYLHSFQTFYTVLIFSDILIVLIALRYTLNYYKIFRYSAFVLATIMLRIALSAEIIYDVLIGVVTAIFMLILTLSYNYFLREVPEK